MKFFLIQLTAFLFLLSCNQESNRSNLQKKKEVEKKKETNMNVEPLLREYLNGLINGDKETISKYLYKDAVKYVNEYTTYDFRLEEFIEEEITKPALEAKSLYQKKGVQHYYKIDKKINSINLKNNLITAYQVSDNLVLGEKSIRDTIRILSFQKGNDIEFINIAETIENILLYRFTETEVKRILNVAFEGNYSNYQRKRNERIFKEYKWKLEGFGNNKNDLYVYDRKLKSKMLSEGLGEMPEKLEFSNSRNKLKLINLKGKRIYTNYMLLSETIQLPYGQSMNDFIYTLQESGLGLYYLDIFFNENNKRGVLTYKSHEKEN